LVDLFKFYSVLWSSFQVSHVVVGTHVSCLRVQWRVCCGHM